MSPRKTKQEVLATCGCGRSPTGQCCGWHGLTEDDYRVKLAEYEDLQNKQAYEQSRTKKSIDV